MIDNTPLNFNPITDLNRNNFKRKVLDQIIYPVSTKFVTYLNLFKYPELANFSFDVDQLLFSERGSGFLALVQKLKGLVSLKDSNLFIQGCGLGHEALKWSELGVKTVVGMDLFNFENSWSQIIQAAQNRSIKLLDGDFCHTQLEAQTFDIISSFAVWEHVKNFDTMLEETKRLVKPEGIVLSAFGPLWYTFGGDHFSAIGGLETGYNHILLSQPDYSNWIDTFEPQSSWAVTDESYFEIRNHINEGLFSYLKPREYIQKVEKHFTRVHTMAIISAEGLAFRSAYPSKWQSLLALEQVREEDLLIKSLIFFLSPSH